MSPGRQIPHNRVKQAAAQQLEGLKRAGVTHLGKRKPLKTAPKKAVAAAVETPPAEPPKKASAPAPAGDRVAALEAVRRKVARCTLCQELAATRTQTVFGVGNPHTRLVFLGEAPGADEDLQGEPFVGRAGQLLNDIITKGMKLRREDVYILNILKCRPPNNRNPLPDEAANCRPFLDAQLEILKPEAICCLGSVAAKNLLNTDVPIGKLRGRVFRHGDAKVVCTYHPAYLLRNPSAKRETWDDIKLLMAEMGMPAG